MEIDSNLEEVAPGFNSPRDSLVNRKAVGTRWGSIICSFFPRAAAKARQPWAVGRNRFAVRLKPTPHPPTVGDKVITVQCLKMLFL